MNADIAFRVVVLPVPVPPEMRMLSLPLTQAARNWAAFGEREPKEIRSFIVYGSRENFLIVKVGPLRASGGMKGLSRGPLGRRASAIREDSATPLPSLVRILLVMRRRRGVFAHPTRVWSILSRP